LKNLLSRAFIALLGCLLLAACSKQQAGTPASVNDHAAQSAANYDPATAATISGTIHFSGAPPKPKPINMATDPDCAGQNEDESLVVHDGKLANVVVYLKDPPKIGMMGSKMILTGGSNPDPTSGIINQRGCRYVPHVVAVMKGQRVVIFNHDETTHNVHPKPKVNHEWNMSQLAHAEPLEKVFMQPEMMIPVTCNVHPWMKAYINVMDTLFYAVSGQDGSFTIEGLPPGTYTLAAVHETLGEQTMQITVGPKQKASVGFTFAGARDLASATK
jgi:hypothetical protein